MTTEFDMNDRLGACVADGTAVAGQRPEYAFDEIGNRTSIKAGGDAGGAALRVDWVITGRATAVACSYPREHE